jgi:hypothetical protein
MEGKIIFIDEKLKISFEELKNYNKGLYEELEKAFFEISMNIYCGRNVKTSKMLFAYPISLNV